MKKRKKKDCGAEAGSIYMGNDMKIDDFFWEGGEEGWSYMGSLLLKTLCKYSN